MMLFEYLFKMIVNQNIATLIINEIQAVNTAISR